jgi:hypothetical protein
LEDGINKLAISRRKISKDVFLGEKIMRSRIFFAALVFLFPRGFSLWSKEKGLARTRARAFDFPEKFFPV